MSCDPTGAVPDPEPQTMTLLPPPPGTCRFCAVAHPAGDPHNAESLYYKYRFYGTHGRWPRWSDALAHCGERTTWNWVNELRRMGAWTKDDDDAMNDSTAVAEPLDTP